MEKQNVFWYIFIHIFHRLPFCKMFSQGSKWMDYCWCFSTECPLESEYFLYWISHEGCCCGFLFLNSKQFTFMSFLHPVMFSTADTESDKYKLFTEPRSVVETVLPLLQSPFLVHKGSQTGWLTWSHCFFTNVTSHDFSTGTSYCHLQL